MRKARFAVIAMVALAIPSIGVGQQRELTRAESAALLRLIRTAGSGSGGVRASSKQLPTSRSCCSAFGGFNFSGVLAVSSTSGGTACDDCTATIPNPDLAIKFPESILFRGQSASSTMTFHSQIAGPCTAAFGWFNVSLNQFIDGGSMNLPDCGANNVWFVEFFDHVVPNLTQVVGTNILLGLITASNGTSKVDFEQFTIQ